MSEKLPDGFWARIRKDAPNGCWVWTGGKIGIGYGRYKGAQTHRLSYASFKGPIARGLQVCHRCDNPACVNPDHLFLGTLADNMADKLRKGRQKAPLGMKHGSAKLTDDQVRAIRSDKRSYRAVAAEYGVTHSTIGYVKRGDGWRHVSNGVSPPYSFEDGDRDG